MCAKTSVIVAAQHAPPSVRVSLSSLCPTSTRHWLPSLPAQRGSMYTFTCMYSYIYGTRQYATGTVAHSHAELIAVTQRIAVCTSMGVRDGVTFVVPSSHHCAHKSSEWPGLASEGLLPLPGLSSLYHFKPATSMPLHMSVIKKQKLRLWLSRLQIGGWWIWVTKCPFTHA